MMLIKDYIFYLLKELREKIYYLNYKPRERKLIIKNVPYFSQWESRELVRDIIDGKISAQNDPLWSNSGAKNKSEYELWSWNACGMACLKMVLMYKFKKNYLIVELGKGCEKFGGYVKRGKDVLDGLYYKPFIRFAKEKFNLDVKVASPMVMADVIKEMERGNFVITSVSYEIRNPTNTISFRGGHLVLVVGYDFDNQTLYVHNPSGTSKNTQEYAKISFPDFNKLFAYRGIVIS
ncbi:hypothetical protein C4577_00740 [Candidatus Parcubacteria bacterium]|nr:MAG: hypothetical protein C4577_00740 [Candidatus Parcubacteria bacterium]